jgi:FtsH ternary system domain X3-analog
MAELTIMLRRDPTTGKQNVIIKLDSDADALPYEHEQMHRELVEKLLGKSLEDFGEVIVEREAAPEPATPQGNAPEQERQKEKRGN